MKKQEMFFVLHTLVIPNGEMITNEILGAFPTIQEALAFVKEYEAHEPHKTEAFRQKYPITDAFWEAVDAEEDLPHTTYLCVFNENYELDFYRIGKPYTMELCSLVNKKELYQWYNQHYAVKEDENEEQ